MPSNKPLTSAVTSYNYPVAMTKLYTVAEGLSTQNILGTTDPTRMTPPELYSAWYSDNTQLDLKPLVVKMRFGFISALYQTP